MNPEQTKQLLFSLHIPAKVTDNDTMQVLNLFTDLEHYSKLIDYLGNNNIDYSEFQENVYSLSEVQSSELLEMISNVYCGYPQPEDNYQEVSYDMQSKCPRCSYIW